MIAGFPYQTRLFSAAPVGAFLLVTCISTLHAAPLASDSDSPSDERRQRLADALCTDDAPTICRCSDPSADATPTITATLRGQFLDPDADELIAHVDRCDRVATVLFRRGERADTWKRVAVYEDVHTDTCRRFNLQAQPDRLVCHRTVEDDTWRVGFFHALRFGPEAVERRQLTHYASNARGCPAAVLRTQHPIGWRTWHRPDDPRPPLLALMFEHHDGRVPDGYDDACDAMNDGHPVFGPRRRRTEYFEWRDGRFTFAGATEMRPKTGDEATWTTPERLDGPICRQSDAVERIEQKHDALRQCYVDRLRNGSEASGTLTLKWTVGRNGDVESIEVQDDTLGDEPLQTCVRDLLRTMSFPEPRGGDTCSFVYPFEFSTQGANN